MKSEPIEGFYSFKAFKNGIVLDRRRDAILAACYICDLEEGGEGTDCEASGECPLFPHSQFNPANKRAEKEEKP